ncbi:hypothetical protein DM02DRAFT_336736 [Periconia macrospinosa]|uniref:Zn(2)-C6 fungal-type domain-containing protein n=1 Tax=Periconia macrospinosa TaxID=97972 RepID=A0A2V1DUH5_9PLEO|nr:hypothetical protein DM02DRAFT_336736 [Periconia macrospinosa]
MSQETNDPQAAENSATTSRTALPRDHHHTTSTSYPEDTSRRKSSTKSRNGCVTCKARRVKCDETKPGCNQCARRRMKCGGYRKDIRFRTVEKPLAAAAARTSKPDHRPRASIVSLPKSDTIVNHSSVPRIEDDPVSDLDFLNGANGENVLSSVENPSNLATNVWHGAAGFDMTFPDIGLELPWHILPEFDVPGLVNDEGIAFEQGVDFDEEGVGHAPNVTAQPCTGTTPFNLDLGNFLLTCSPSPPHELPDPLSGPYAQEEADSIERVASLFHQQTCQLLSIYEEPSKNPWSTLIWPMVKDSKALFHAVAAMTCLQLSRTQPAMRDRGLVHIQKSTQALEIELNSGTMQMEAALAATIALGFAETWDHQKSSTGRDHIKGARILLQQSLTNHMSNSQNGTTTEQSARLRFLANTWIYMDVIARLTSDCGSPFNPETLSVFSTLNTNDPSPSLSPSTNELDPLMGYASTLFPLIGRVGDLISHIRKRRTALANSPAIISRANSLRRAIQNWTLAVDLEQIENPTSNMSDAIQTAEAYRWSTLLYLQQAVPELPNLSSVGELGRKTLVYLATIESESHTAIVHTYPLMVAGSEAVEEEDREFVRERWGLLAKRMRTGIVERCLEITEEVWRRRDDFLKDMNQGLENGGVMTGSPAPAPPPPAKTSPSERIDADPQSQPHPETEQKSSTAKVTAPNAVNSNGRTEKETSPWAAGASVSAANRRTSTAPGAARSEFPISAAFKKGVDWMTRSGSLEYTVRGRLHFLGVMEDWGWEVMLG